MKKYAAIDETNRILFTANTKEEVSNEFPEYKIKLIDMNDVVFNVGFTHGDDHMYLKDA